MRSFLNSIIFPRLALAGQALAATEVATPEALKGPSLITFPYLVQLFFSLLIVFGLIYIMARYLLPKLKISTKGRLIQVVDKVGLEPQVSAYILKVGKQSWLVVVSNKQVARIDRLEEVGEVSS